MRNSADEYVGKTLEEVKKLHEVVHVSKVGEVGYMRTADYKLSRLNVELSPENVRFSTKVLELGGEKYEMLEANQEDFPKAVIVRAWFG